MPSILGYNGEPVPCKEKFVDKSVYFEDATILFKCMDMGEFRRQIGKQMNIVMRYSSTTEISCEMLHEEITKLRDVVRVLARLEQIEKEEIELKNQGSYVNARGK